MKWRLWNRLVLLLCLLPVSAFARWYDAGTGRFLSEDPLLGDILSTKQRLSNPVGMHAWLYANGSPVVYTDPDGRVANDRYGNEYLSPALRKACDRGTASCASFGFGELRRDCSAGNQAACAVAGGYATALTAPAFLFKPVILGWAALSLFSSKGHNPGDQKIVDPLTAGFEGTFGEAYKCGEAISQGDGATMSCGLTAFNLVMLGHAGRMSRASRLAAAQEEALARAGSATPLKMLPEEAASIAGENAFPADEFERLTRPAPVAARAKKGASLFDDLTAVKPRSRDKVQPVESLRLGDSGFEGVKLDEPYLYIVDEAGEMSIALRGSPTSGVKHTQISGGQPAKAGGELLFGENRTVRINAQSGRYRAQSANAVERVAERLREAGYSPSIVKEEF